MACKRSRPLQCALQEALVHPEQLQQAVRPPGMPGQPEHTCITAASVARSLEDPQRDGMVAVEVGPASAKVTFNGTVQDVFWRDVVHSPQKRRMPGADCNGTSLFVRTLRELHGGSAPLAEPCLCLCSILSSHVCINYAATMGPHLDWLLHSSDMPFDLQPP